ncbi:ADP-ribosylglycohydrolase family protein [Brevibacterium sp. 91QC2O2]|uniref:ADP-ribosylglycohydrolase family protein n=1 Tax=Brevibacterium sp. 91QC2O2 TaxID=2968458 RepID=UPI00211C855C|nr:ADP-ribosylglycohydrolase family protein [Brevibacterium sp. 91QC2O2]
MRSWQSALKLWESRIAEAEVNPPTHFSRNGWVVHALQAAWSSIVHTGDRADNDPRHLQRALELAVRSGGDTDTVAAIAGGLIGATYGVSAVPLDWKRAIHGWPGWRSEELIENAIEQAGLVEYSEEDSEVTDNLWPQVDRMNYSAWDRITTCVQDPHDSGLYLGGVRALDDLPREVDAVVSLCRIGRKQVPARVSREDRVAVWLPDAGDPAGSAHMDYVLTQAADMVATLRAEGHTVLLHCVQAYSRTPTVAALYAARHLGVDPDQSMAQVVSALSGAHPTPTPHSGLRTGGSRVGPRGRAMRAWLVRRVRWGDAGPRQR